MITIMIIIDLGGEIYCFAQNTNCTWRHGVLQENPIKKTGRISIICWGFVENIN